MIRDTIFIGHATPDDNEFTLWLQSKLKNEGYNCECDLSLLLGGEADYWKNLQEFLESRTIKYVLVISNTTFSKNGVLDEWEHCKSIEKQHNLSDFIIPVKIDNTSFSTRIGLNRKNIISFEENWATGLKRLIRKLTNDQVPKEQANTYSINDWYENVYTNWSGIEKETQDTFFSNWVEIPKIPENVFFYKFYNEEQAKAVLKNNIIYPAYRHGNILVTFQKSLEYYLNDKDFEIKPTETICKKSKDAFIKYEDSEFPTYSDFRRLLVRLLKECFECYLMGKELLKFELSNSACFYFEHKPDDKAKGKFIVNEKSKNIGVTGKYYDAFWHYAISFRPMLYPEICFSIKNHIIFTENGKKAWNDPKKMHKARRDKGKNMRNKEWRDQLLAFLSSLSDTENGEIIIPVAEDENIVLSTTPITFNASFSYIEPNDKERLTPIDSFLDEEDYYDDEETKLAQ
jgi:hypothetical protein